jgi:small-conductance mechanosensitive channel
MLSLLAQTVPDPEIEPTADGPSLEVFGPPIPEAGVTKVSFLDGLNKLITDGDFGYLDIWAHQQLLSFGFWFDVILIATCLILAWILSRILVRAFKAGKLPLVTRLKEKLPASRKLSPFRITAVPLLWIALLIANTAGQPCPATRALALALTIFVAINLPFRFVRWRLWTWFIAMTSFTILALHITGWLGIVSAVLDSWAISLGSGSRLSALGVVQGLLVFAGLFWIAGQLATFTGRQLDKNQAIDPSLRVLFRKTTRVVLYVVAIVISVAVTGVDITAISIFGGALGLGIGFGLQKVVSNLVSGVILLLDKSIKPGDVIEVDGAYGWINQLNMRYASVVTRDNKEYLIPNEDLITNPVINWSYSDKLVRVRAPVGIAYDSDVRKAMKLAEEATAKVERVEKKPAPVCRLMGFGDSSVDMEIRFWIDDPTDGVNGARSEVLLEIWDAFNENGIGFPFPQRDLHIRTGGDAIQQLLEIEEKPKK